MSRQPTGSAISDPSPADAWQTALRDAVRSTTELAEILGLPQILAENEGGSFPLRVPRSFVRRMRAGDPNDPLLLQILPTTAEFSSPSGFDDDPLQERRYAAEGVLRKYSGRALLITTGACPVHCRYCFRREFPYGAENAARGAWQPALDAVADDPSISEVILSGGDPLSLPDARLARLLAKIAEIEHVGIVRVHTRFPVVIPERVTDELCALLADTRLRAVVVVHVNHPREVDDDVSEAFAKLADASAALLNQSVLLRRINDDVGTLTELSRRLFAASVLPYYLHVLDPVTGAGHFDVPDAQAVELHRGLRAELPGYLVPRLVREIPGELSKTLLI